MGRFFKTACMYRKIEIVERKIIQIGHKISVITTGTV
jgi:hypothetical protein